MATLVKTDKLGNETWVEDKCPKCNGNGYIQYFGFNQGGVCFKCGGSGRSPYSWVKHSEAGLEAIKQRKLKTAPKRNAKFFEKNGFSEEGKTWIVLGKTYEIKDELKEQGAKYSELFGWHFDHDPKFEKFTCFELDMRIHGNLNDYGDYNLTGLRDLLDEANAKLREVKKPESKSTFQGSIGDKITVELKLVNSSSFESQFGVAFYHRFLDSDENVYVWKTNKCLEGVDYTLKGTVKDHQEYRGEQQTVLTRCKEG